ncbi:HEAT repeat domain-containing protein, partial [bacterium]|nr:HEAT repeat domain-containing protein [bacterium]
AKMLASSDNRDGINYFINMLEDPSAGRRLIGVASLGNIGHPRGVMPTLGLLNDGSDYVRWGATQVLGAFGDIRTTGFLSQSLKDANLWVQISAVNSLQAIGDKNTIDDVYEILEKNPEPAVTVAALDLISRMGDKHMADDIALHLGDNDAGVRFATAVCLTRLNDEKGRGIEFFEKALESTETVTISPGLPPISPLETGVKLLAAELTDTPESRIKELVTKPQKVVSWAHAAQILIGEIATAEAYNVIAEETLIHRHLQVGLLEYMVQPRPTAYAAFEPFLGNGEAEIRQLGYDILVRFGGDRVLDRLTEQLSEYPQDAPALIAALDSLEASTRLRELFRTAEESVRILIAQQIAGWTDKRMPLIWGQIATEDHSLAVRMVVLNSLASDPTGVGMVYLTQIIEDSDSPPELVSAAKDALAAVEIPPPPPPEEPETVS